VVGIDVVQGQAVRRGDVLLRLESPELQSRAERAQLRSEGYAVEVARSSAGHVQLERRLVVEEQLGEALADSSGAQAEMATLTLVAPQDGRIVDMPSDLVVGRWINPRHPLLRIVDDSAGEIEAYLDESQVGAVAVGQAVTFYPDAPHWPVLRGTIVEVDASAGHTVPHPLLASTNGGGIAATQTANDSLVAHEAIYRVRVRTAAGQAGFGQIARGSVRIEANWLAVSWRGFARMASVLVRESGF